jgi:hypothetical protein
MTYKPNFNDPRIKARVRKALNFVELYLRPNRINWVASAELYQVFGNTSRQPARFLKETMLTVADPYYNKDTRACIKYRLNAEGVNRIKQLAGLEDFVPEISPDLEQQLASGDFEYETKSDRLFNQIQFYNREVRGSLLNNHGYRYNYDIEAAAPTLLLQQAQQRDRDFTAPALEQYITNRSAVRQQLAQECGITESQVKFVINAVLQGGVISCFRDSRIFNELHCNYEAIRHLQHNAVLLDIRDDIREMWRILKEDFPQRTVTDRLGRTRSARLSGRDKSGYYRQLESQVGRVIRRHLKKNNIRCLWLHDGWCCDRVVDTAALITQVRQQTGFVIQLDRGVYE